MRPELLEAARTLINAGGFKRTEAVITRYEIELTSAEALQLLALQLPRHESGSREHRVIAARLSAIERVMSKGTKAVFAGYEDAAQAILSILNAQDWGEVRSAIESNLDHLVSPVADIAFADLVMQPAEPEDESRMLGGWALVEQCRVLGIEAALAGRGSPVQPESAPRSMQIEKGEALTLADALREQAGYSGTTDMRNVIVLYRAALTTLTPESEPEQFAHAQQYLGDAYMLDASGDQSHNAEAAIECYEVALGLRRRDAEPLRWATIMAHLGEALLRRAHDDPSVNVDRSVGVLEQAIEVLEGGSQSALLASARLAIAAALTARITGSRDENLRAAALQLRTAMEDVQRAEHPDIWAMASAHLGSVYLSRAGLDLHERERLLKQAEQSFRAALDVAGTGPRVRARAHAGLAWALSDQADGGPEADEEAVVHHMEAIALHEKLGRAFDVERAHAHRNLAIQYAERRFGNAEENIAAASRHFDQALELFSPDDYPVERRDTFRPMASMYFNARQWTDAHRCFDQAIATSGGVLANRTTRPGKEAEVAENRDLYGPAAYALLRLGRRGEALEVIERGKVRMLAEALARNEARGSTPRLDLASMLAVIPDGSALVAPIVTSQGSAVFVVPGGSTVVEEAHVVELESLTVAAVMELLAGSAGSGGWLNAYLSWLNNRNSFPELFEVLEALTTSLWDVLVGPIHARLKKLGIDGGAPVMIMPSGWLGILPLHAARRLEGERWIAFGAEYVVSYAPSIGALEACRRRLEARSRQSPTLFAVANPTGDLRFAGDETASIAELFVDKASSPGTARVLAGDAATRANVIGEVRGASYVHFACHAEFHWANAAESGLLLANGRLRIEDILSPEMDLGSSHLVTLSACETGMTEFRTMPDEFIGLAGALLEAGAPAVISSLWPVDDISTKLLLTEMYRLHLGGMSVAAALQGAQRWVSEATAEELGLAAVFERSYTASGSMDESALRSWQYYEMNERERPFAHPFYWAAFTLTGAA